jgi:hypothetical protein
MPLEERNGNPEPNPIQGEEAPARTRTLLLQMNGRRGEIIAGSSPLPDPRSQLFPALRRSDVRDLTPGA